MGFGFEMPPVNQRKRVDDLGDEKKEELAYKEKSFREKLSNRGMPKENIGEMANEISDETLEKMEMEGKAEKAEAENRIDPLTGIANRRALEEIGEKFDKMKTREKKENEHNFSILMLDIDHFKKVNDTYGHAAGDEILKEVANLIRKSVRETDSACRYGGEEFTIVLPETDANGAAVLAEKIRKNIENSPVKLDDGQEIPVTVSVGVFGSNQVSVEDEMSFEKMREAADKALYSAKDSGRNRVSVFENKEESS